MDRETLAPISLELFYKHYTLALLVLQSRRLLDIYRFDAQGQLVLLDLWTTSKERLQVGAIFKGIIPIMFADLDAHQWGVFYWVKQILRDGA
jgi:hypothetical protein